MTAPALCATTTLRTQQQAFACAVMQRRDELAPPLRPFGKHGALLGIYQHAYEARLTEALRDNLGILHRVMGDEAFDALAHAYVRAHPSTHPSIRWFGDRLIDFMRRTLDEEGEEALVPHPALVDLARLEWALRTAFDAIDAQPMRADSLASLAPQHWPRMVLSLHPSVQLLLLDWAIEPVWQAFKSMDAEEPEMPEPQPHSHALVVWREGLETRWRSVDGLEHQALACLREGVNFAQLCTLAAGPEGEDARQAATLAASWLQTWLADGWLSGWYLE